MDANTLRDDGLDDLRAVRDQRRYRRIIDDAISSCNFSRGEACAIVDALNGLDMLTMIGDADYSTPWWPMEVADAISLNHLDAKWSVDGAALIKKIGALTTAQLIAVADAAERFWREPARPTDDLLRETGLWRAE